MAWIVFFVTYVTIIMYTVITTSQPITNHMVKRNVAWAPEESRWIWLSSHEAHYPRHFSSYDSENHHEHDENCGHTLIYHLPTHHHRHYSGHSIDYYRHKPHVYPPLAPIHDPSAPTTPIATTTTQIATTITPIATPTTINYPTVNPPIDPAPIFEETDEETDDDGQISQSISTTVQNTQITEINPGVESTTRTTKPSSGIDLRFGA